METTPSQDPESPSPTGAPLEDPAGGPPPTPDDAEAGDAEHEEEESPGEHKGALDKDNPPVPDDAGEQGGGTATGGDDGLEGGSEPGGGDIRQHERP